MSSRSDIGLDNDGSASAASTPLEHGRKDSWLDEEGPSLAQSSRSSPKARPKQHRQSPASFVRKDSWIDSDGDDSAMKPVPGQRWFD